jgi:hypothetical protein
MNNTLLTKNGTLELSYDIIFFCISTKYPTLVSNYVVVRRNSWKFGKFSVDINKESGLKMIHIQ